MRRAKRRKHRQRPAHTKASQGVAVSNLFVVPFRHDWPAHLHAYTCRTHVWRPSVRKVGVTDRHASISPQDNGLSLSYVTYNRDPAGRTTYPGRVLMGNLQILPSQCHKARPNCEHCCRTRGLPGAAPLWCPDSPRYLPHPGLWKFGVCIRVGFALEVAKTASGFISRPLNVD